jgi:hypothetical protein
MSGVTERSESFVTSWVNVKGRNHQTLIGWAIELANDFIANHMIEILDG